MRRLSDMEPDTVELCPEGHDVESELMKWSFYIFHIKSRL